MAETESVHGSLSASRSIAEVSSAQYTLVTWPSATWSGTAGSGFANVPADPVRTTAKPALRLIVPSDQFYADKLLVGVWAGANNQGSLADNMGLEKIRVHYEGTIVDINSPGFRTFVDANGQNVSYFGWWIILHHDGRNGTANLYFEAIPKDKSMQARVIGPCPFSPVASLYDHDLTIAPSQTQIVGSRYQTPAAALSYLIAQNAKNPRIRLMETATYSSWSQSAPYAPTGWLTVEAAAGVTATIGKTAYSSAEVRPKFDGIHFRGANIIIDMRYMSEIRTDLVNGRNDWFDGVTFTDSSGANPLWQGRFRPVQWAVRNNPWFTECTFTNVADPARGATLVRGCTFSGCYDDTLSGALCSVGNVIKDDINSFYATPHPVFTVQYNGAGRSATLEISLERFSTVLNRPGIPFGRDF